jgi:hypothetical protein
MLQVRCVELLLKQRVPMTLDQLTILVHSLPTLDDPTVHALWTQHSPSAKLRATGLSLLSPNRMLSHQGGDARHSIPRWHGQVLCLC